MSSFCNSGKKHTESRGSVETRRKYKPFKGPGRFSQGLGEINKRIKNGLD